MRLPPRPDLSWKDDGTPVNTGVGDVYYSVENGLEEARAVFLAGCGLPERFGGRDSFTVAELGFGTGLNFLALWQLWRANRGDCEWLNFVSFEGFPLDSEDAARALSAWPELAQVAEMLVENWPVRAKGVRRVVWPQERLSLTLHIGDIDETLAQSQVMADAWFLDGFSPAKNEDMWTESLWPLLFERCRPGARLATFTVAGAVRRGLEAAGFRAEKVPGHGRKRHRLEVYFPEKHVGETVQGGSEPGDNRGSSAGPPVRSAAKRVAIIGAGIAGANLAHAMTGRGAKVTVFETSEAAAQGTSGNPLALVMPRLDAGDTAEARLVIDAYLMAQSVYGGLPGAKTAATQHRPHGDKEAARFEKVLANPPLGLEQLEATAHGVLHKRALILRPALLLPALLAGAQVHWGEEAKVDVAARTVNGEAFDAVVLASGWQMQAALPWLRLDGRAGQVEWMHSAVDAPPSALVSSDYALASGRLRLWGATFGPHESGEAQASEAGHTENMAALLALRPDWLGEVERVEILSRAGIRATPPDRLPVVGGLLDYDAALEAFAGLRNGLPVPDEVPEIDGVYLAGGFGARGFTWGPWAAQVITAQVFDDPQPATRDGMALVAPIRQVWRDLKRGLI